MTERRARSGMLDDHGLDRVGDVLEAVEGLLQLLDDVLPYEHVAGRVLGVEVVEVGPGPAVQPIALVLPLVDGDQGRPQRVLAPARPHRLSPSFPSSLMLIRYDRSGSCWSPRRLRRPSAVARAARSISRACSITASSGSRTLWRARMSGAGPRAGGAAARG